MAVRHVIGNVSEFPDGSHKVVEVGSRAIGVFNMAGELYALPNICPHQSGPLCEGRRTTGTLSATAASDWFPEWVYSGEIITCPWHGLEYHVPTGRCLAYPNVRLRRYPVIVEGDLVAVELPGAPAPRPA